MRINIYILIFVITFLMCGCPAEPAPNHANSSINKPPITPTPSPVNTAYPTNNHPADSNSQGNKNVSVSMPEFPFPPNASASYDIDPAWLKNPNEPTTFGDVNAKLRNVLRSGGYQSLGYYSVASFNGGFVITTAVEQFQSNGSPVTGPNRFTRTPTSPSVFSTEYLRNLIRGNQGRYRLIALMVTDRPFANNDNTPSIDQAESLATSGMNQLPQEMRSLSFTDQHYCTALIYEFRKDRADSSVDFVRSSDVSAEAHLQSILRNLRR